MPKPRKYAGVRGGPREDLTVRVRSGWEANFQRVLTHLQLSWTYESETFPFPKITRGQNRHYRPDYFLWGPPGIELVKDGGHSFTSPRELPWLIEIKGLLPRGGRLTRVNLEPLRKVDHDSYVKLRYFSRYYPDRAARTWVVGDREYRWLTKRYRWLPYWEARSVKKKKAA